MAGLVPAIHEHCLNVTVSRSGGFFRSLLTVPEIVGRT